MGNIELIVNGGKTINDALTTNYTTYSSEKISALLGQVAKIVSGATGEILVKNSSGEIINSGLTLNQLALALHNHDADDIILSNVNFGGFLNLGITNIQQLADYIDDHFTELQEQGTKIIGEVPNGTINGANTLFSLTYSPIRHILFLNGVRQKVSLDYINSSNIINFTIPPVPGDVILVDYSY